MTIYGHRRLLTGFAFLTSLAPLTGACGEDDGGRHRLRRRRPATSASCRTGPASEGEAFQAVIDGFMSKYPKVHGEGRAGAVRPDPGAAHPAVRGRHRHRTWPWPCPAWSAASPTRTCCSTSTRSGTSWIEDGEYTDALRQIASGPDGQPYAVFFKGNVNALVWYSPQQLEPSSGRRAPTTWAEFTAAMDKAKADGVAPFAVGGKDGWPLDPVDRPGHPARRRRREPSTTWPGARSAGTTRGSSSRSRCSAA